MARALELCAEHGGEVTRRAARGVGGDAVSSWREAFLGAPYLRDVLVAAGVLAETFETAITWERFAAFHERVSAAAEQSARESLRRAGPACSAASPTSTPTVRRRTSPCSHPRAAARRSSSGRPSSAPSPTRSSREGGTITHHHAVGRDHRPWYDRQRPEPFARGAARRQAAARPRGHHEPRRADRSRRHEDRGARSRRRRRPAWRRRWNARATRSWSSRASPPLPRSPSSGLSV